MYPVIITLSGKKGSGKNTAANFAMQYFQRKYLKLWTKTFNISPSAPDSHLVMETLFADELKKFCINVLDLHEAGCYGSDAEKNQITKYKWSDMPQWLLKDPKYENKSGFLTCREVMQLFGTECVRNFFGNVWADSTMRKILKQKPLLAIITDNRFPSEVETVLKYPKTYVIRLTRSPYIDDQHDSETSLDNYAWDKIDKRICVLDNSKMSVDEQNFAITPILDHIFSKPERNSNFGESFQQFLDQ